MMQVCSVAACRFAWSHETRYHRCGTCGGSFHGQLECGDPAAQAALRALPQRTYPGPRCAVAGCADPDSHASAAHLCLSCGARRLCGCSPSAQIVSVAPPPSPSPPAPSPAPSPAPALLAPSSPAALACPLCKVAARASLDEVVFTGAACVVCLEDGPLAVLRPCRHACVCAACALRLAGAA